MYIKRLLNNDINDVMELQNEIVKENLRRSNFDSINGYDKNEKSLVAYCNGKLVGYIIYFTLPSGDVYTSNIVSKNPRALKPLLIKFFRENMFNNIFIEFEKENYNLFEKIIYKYKEIINVHKVELVEESLLEHRKTAYQVILSVKRQYIYSKSADLIQENLKKQIKNKIEWICFYTIYNTDGRCVELDEVLSELYPKFSIEEIEENKNLILRTLNSRNLDFFNMIGPKLNIVIHNYTLLRRENSEAFKNKLIEKGYVSNDSSINYVLYDMDLSNMNNINKNFHYDVDRSSIKWYHVQTLDNTKYNNNTLSYYRWKIKRDIIRYFKGQKYLCNVSILNKNGNLLCNVSPNYTNIYHLIPRNYSNIFDYKINIQRFREKIKTLGSIDYIETMIHIRKYSGEKVALEFFNRICKVPYIETNGPKWLSALSDFFSKKIMNFITKGVLTKMLLTLNLEEMQILSDCLVFFKEQKIPKSLEISIRKLISRNIVRKEKAVESTIEEIFELVDIYVLYENNIVETENLFKISLDFIKSVRKYIPTLTIKLLFEQFKNNTIDILCQIYQGVFEERHYNLNSLDSRIECKCSPEYIASISKLEEYIIFGCNDFNRYCLEKGYGIYNVYFEDNIISRALLWINKEYNCLVVDHLKVDYKYYNPYTHLDELKECYKTMLYNVLSEYNLSFAVQNNINSNIHLYYSEYHINMICEPLYISNKNIKKSISVSAIPLLKYEFHDGLVKEELDIIRLIEDTNKNVYLEQLENPYCQVGEIVDPEEEDDMLF